MDSEARGRTSSRNTRRTEVITIEPGGLITPATVGLTIAEGKAIVESLQREIVAAQIQYPTALHALVAHREKHSQACDRTSS
jgi:hypothetical protein